MRLSSTELVVEIATHIATPGMGDNQALNIAERALSNAQSEASRLFGHLVGGADDQVEQRGAKTSSRDLV
jgi:hypothetical protein